MLRGLTLGVFMAACGPTPPGPDLALDVHGDDVTAEERRLVELEARAFWFAFADQTHLDDRFSGLEERVRGYRIDLHEDLGCRAEGQCIAGLSYCWLRSISIERQYLGTGVLIHELVHAAQGCVGWVLEGGENYPGSDWGTVGHEGWSNHHIWEQIDYARTLLAPENQR